MTDKAQKAIEALSRIGKIIVTKIPHNPQANSDYETLRTYITSTAGQRGDVGEAMRVCKFDKYGRCSTKGCGGAYTDDRLCKTSPASVNVIEWHYSTNYGPEGEANYANVFKGNELVGNLRIQHAMDICIGLRSYEQLKALQPHPPQPDKPKGLAHGIEAPVICHCDKSKPDLKNVTREEWEAEWRRRDGCY